MDFPDYGIKLINNLVLKGGESSESIKRKRKFNKTREAWIAAVFLLGKITTEKKLWYLRGNEIENSSDDIYARSIWKEDGIVYSDHVLPIQIVRKTEYQRGDIVSVIQKKLEDDLRGTSLVCYVMTTGIIDWQQINKKISKMDPQIKDITLIGNVGGGKFIVGRVYPDIHTTIIVDIDSIQINAPQIIELTEVTKPEKTGITKQGTALLIPTFKIR